ncbi:RNA-binding KH domain-containing protein PEPPER [Linum perenne]
MDSVPSTIVEQSQHGAPPGIVAASVEDGIEAVGGAQRSEANEGMEVALQTEAAAAQQHVQAQPKWPGWPGHNVFRLIVPVAKVGSIIGRKGELIKKMCEETRARVRILEGPQSTPDRIVLISGKEEPEAPLSPAMDAVLRVFKRVSDLSNIEGDSTSTGASFCSIKLLVASSQAINLIGKQGSTIRSIQESSGASVRVLLEDESPSYAASDERLVEVHGESLKVLSALEAITGQLRKFLVDSSVIPVFEKTYTSAISQERSADANPDRVQPPLQSVPASQTGMGYDYSLSLKRDPSLFDSQARVEQRILQSGLSLYGQEHHALGLRSTGLGHASVPIVTQVTQTMKVPLSYAGDIIGVDGSNIAYIRRVSGAVLIIQESRGFPDEIIVEIKGTTSEVDKAQQLIQEFVSNHHKEPMLGSGLYGKAETGYSSYTQSQLQSQLPPETSYSSYSPHLGTGGYGGSPGLGLGGYSGYRY